MRIAFVVNNYPPKVGGLEAHVHSLARHLAARDHDVQVVALARVAGTAIEDGIRVTRLSEHLPIADVLGFPSLGTTRALARRLREEEVEVVSVHTRFFPMSWVGLRAGRRAGAAVVHTEHGSGHVVSPSAVIRWASRTVDLTLGRFVLRTADVVLGVSEQVVAFVARLSGREARVFYNAIEPPEPGVRTPRPRHLVFVGRLVSGKGAEQFVDVVANLVASGYDVTGEVLGDGEERAALEARIRDRGLVACIEVRGRVSQAEVRRSLSGATLINPTALAEGFQTTLLEALAEGGGVVTYPVPGADVLRAQGHEVAVVVERTVEALAAAVRQRIDHTTSSAPACSDLSEWYWSARAEEYVEVCRRAIDRSRSLNAKG